MIVVDVNVLAYLLIPGKFTEAAEQLLTEDSAWVVPRLWRSELRNIFDTYPGNGKQAFANLYDFWHSRSIAHAMLSVEIKAVLPNENHNANEDLHHHIFIIGLTGYRHTLQCWPSWKYPAERR